FGLRLAATLELDCPWSLVPGRPWSLVPGRPWSLVPGRPWSLDVRHSTFDTRNSTFNMASYLVTGGAGFIGSHLVEELVRRRHRVVVVDSLITGKRANLDHVSGVELIEGDLADFSVAQRAAIGMDFVLHQAAIPSVPRSVNEPIA